MITASKSKKRNRTNPELILVFTPKGMKGHIFNTHTAEEEEQMEEILEQIRPCLDVADAMLKRGSLGPTE